MKIVPPTGANPPGKVADAELHFHGGVLDGLKLIGFAVWERRTGKGRNVTFPARQYSINGERRSFALLWPTSDAAAQERVRDLILAALRRAGTGSGGITPSDAPARIQNGDQSGGVRRHWTTLIFVTGCSSIQCW